MLPRLPFVRRVLRGVAGAGWGLSRGFRLLNLYVPYAASRLGRAADAEAGCKPCGRLPDSLGAARAGSREAERTAGEGAPGERSKRSARAFTLVAVWVEGRVAVAVEDEAGPEADLGVGLGVDLGGGRAPFVVAWRWRVGMAMSTSMRWCGRRTTSWPAGAWAGR